MVRKGGLEPPRDFSHWTLNPARLPIPPLPLCVAASILVNNPLEVKQAKDGVSLSLEIAAIKETHRSTAAGFRVAFPKAVYAGIGGSR